jgi:hypothetical protein
VAVSLMAEDWTVQQMARLVEREKRKVNKPGKKRITEQEQVRRFLTGTEMGRVASGEITPTQYHAYTRAMLKKLAGMEV